ncbi:cellulose synthase (UDP-forming) [Panacagrimonas perspica]|uniref:Cellulose synthase catalytic subunit [UDP-forming] n=1 Tax=Panacagrimonas perspica TaxID=381431 RepID=A0A4R7PBD5_9GAMM|nr:UDP-forming cellulose synthase catalytic subunit [Panacagrimonas perspica]TDU30909.1 cellulose synthase (UDP-forming) [Panacagrimonas perspica]THD01937.1 cellulose synthase catalytic subunit (UDP-forming) [Panacagrimonas perspica]
MAEQNLSVRSVAPSGNWDATAESYAGHIGSGNRVLLFALMVLAVGLGYAVVAAPLPLGAQVLFGIVCLVIAILLNRIEGRLVSIGLMAFSTLLSARYIYWRLTESLDYSDPRYNWVDIGFAYGLIAAELYAFTVLLLGYLQTLWPLQRPPVPMPRDLAIWPTVDVMIPTLNEPLAVVRPTIIAAMDMDWPRDRMRVMVLDDGARPEMQALCEELGALYIRRPNNQHAKAGNVNHGLEYSSAEYVAIFDCDHVPTRSFLQISMGWFLKDSQLSMLQTPHHFFSPDPFERNLGTFRSIPNEGELFYGLLQDGNDLWNATFFCGSCAVLRRSALDQIGGIAVETVTEDAHTSLRLQRKGWNTAYINLPQAAGRATESLAAHIRQRVRWARGMSQIFRIDNPLLGPGLSIAQRLCYLNSMLYFFFGLPRIVFLTAPLAFLLFDAQIIIASALVFAAYALPHLIHSQMTHSRLQGPFRYSFWAEVYETILCVYIVLPTFLALISPKLGKFNVTAKGGNRDRSFFDRKIALPYIILLLLNLGGFGLGLWRLFTNFGDDADSLVLNLVWTSYNVVILGVCTAVAWEQREIRRAVRVSAELPARVRLPDGTEISARTLDLSEGGTMLRLPRAVSLPLGSRIQVALIPEFDLVWMDADVTRSSNEILAMKFNALSLPQERQLIYAIFGRADAWLHWAERRPPDKVGTSFGNLFRLGLTGAKKIFSPSRN